ncbi:MAG: polymer-forming cytoskeletal protein [Oscillospiraceae bacterium]|jgi:cytoskeletal protein CcmA (bactofilin family)|nr:polymer-forming cytoskeletal protein [Oscillospiraceae bacterium]
MGLFGTKTKTETEAGAMTVTEKKESPEPAVSTPHTSTVIAANVTINGTLSGEGDIQIEGIVQGEINLKGAVVIMPTGLIKGPISADIIHVAGSVEGNMMARDQVCLEKGGSVDGDVTTPSLVVQAGGRLNGRSSMVNDSADHAVHVIAPPADNFQLSENHSSTEVSSSEK